MQGIGNDIIEIDRIGALYTRFKTHFTKKLFTQAEIDYCMKKSNPIPSFAARFAAKEAIAKALGCGFGAQLSWQDLSIILDDLGKPHVLFSTKAQKAFFSPTILLSISHCHAYSLATAIWL